MASVRAYTARSGDTTWRVLFRHGGRQRSQTFVNQPAAERFAQLIDLLGADRALAELNGATTTTDELLTVDELAERFFDWKASRVTPRTVRDYRRDYANHWQAKIGHRPAASITPADVQAGVDRMAKTLDPKSVRDRHLVLHSIYGYAAAPSRRLVPDNPCEHTDLPKRRRKPVKGVTLAEWHAIYDEARRSEPDASDLLLFLVGSGWRWSEAAALLVRHVEDRGDSMVVFIANVFRRDADDRQVLVEGAKSEAGYRAVGISPEVAAVVRRRIIGQPPDAFVFTTATGRPWRQSNFLARTWRGIIDRTGLERRPTPHWLRHTHVLLIVRAGVPLAEVQRRLGHESIETTIGVYGRMIDDISPAALTQLDTLLVGPPAVVPGAVVAGELE